MTKHRSSSAVGGDIAPMLVGGMIAGMLALAVIVSMKELQAKYLAVLLPGALFLVALPFIRNLRPFCLYMIITLAPLGLRKSFLLFPHMGGAGALYLEIVDPFLLLLLYLQIRDRFKGVGFAYRFPPTCVLWGAMMLLGVANVIFMDALRLTAFNEVVRMAKLLLLVSLIMNEVVRRQQFQHAIVALILGVILESVIAIAEYLHGAQLGLGFLGELGDEDIKILSQGTLSTRESVYRVGGLLGHANLLAAYLALFLPMAVALILTSVSRSLKVLLAMALMLGQPTLVLTLSRTGWIDFSVALAIVLGLGALHPVSRKGFLLARVLIIAGTIIVAAALSPHIIQRLNYSDPNAVEYRLKWLRTARAMIIDYPVLGTGLNTYVYAQLPYAEQKTPTEMQEFYGDYWPAVHNSWVITWAEQGTVGFALWVALHISVIVVAARNLRIRDPMMHALNVGLLAGFIGIMIDGLASFFIRQEATARMFWIAIGLILAIGYWRRVNEKGDPAPTGDSTPPKPSHTDGNAAVDGKWLPYRESVLR